MSFSKSRNKLYFAFRFISEIVFEGLEVFRDIKKTDCVDFLSAHKLSMKCEITPVNWTICPKLLLKR